MLNIIKKKIKESIRKKSKNKAGDKIQPQKHTSKNKAEEKIPPQKHTSKKPSRKRSRKVKDPEAKLEAKRYQNPVASRTLILKTITEAGMMTQSSVFKA
ncbi:MAG: hypothetical protein OQK93_00900, partial [Gammaproteobacteria bacterium]|nr:hypothetical protein [Gammaproteobacteria bacterium]